MIAKPLRLPEALREQLGKPIDNLILGKEENLNQAAQVIKESIHPGGVNNAVVTVGDIVTKSFNEAGMPIDIAIVDFQVKREEKFKNIKELGFAKEKPDVVVKNPKGTLTPESFMAVEEAFREGGTLDKVPPYIIRVIGEEDLLALVAILLAPLDTHVFYGQPRFNRGQPNQGIVEVIVTERKKQEVKAILSQFSS